MEGKLKSKMKKIKNRNGVGLCARQEKEKEKRIRSYTNLFSGYLINIKIICFSTILKIITIRKHFPAAQLYIRYGIGNYS